VWVRSLRNTNTNTNTNVPIQHSGKHAPPALMLPSNLHFNSVSNLGSLHPKSRDASIADQMNTSIAIA
jgi:hypothetical protein